jgi:ketosteroid isomerase-like protein
MELVNILNNMPRDGRGRMNSDAMRELAKKLVDAIEAGDAETVKSLYAPDAVFWMNTTGRTMPARDVAAALPYLNKKVAARRYVDRQIDVFPDGFVHRHKMTGVRRDGATVAVEACVICRVIDGKVVHLDEYCDSIQLRGYME